MDLALFEILAIPCPTISLPSDIMSVQNLVRRYFAGNISAAIPCPAPLIKSPVEKKYIFPLIFSLDSE
jgi:hypothetical protein